MAEQDQGGEGYLDLDTMRPDALGGAPARPAPLTDPHAATQGTGPAANTLDGGGPRPGDIIAERYRLVEELGRGGMGSVFRAEHVQTGGFVAVKFLHTEANAVRFELEARNAAALSHANTVRVIDYGEDRGRRYLTMEYLEGRPLSDLLAADGILPWARVVRIATQVLKALWEAHGLGIVHRDIKAANILVLDQAGSDDFVKVVDFGIARVMDTSGAQTQGVIGSPQVMAPEQWNEGPISPQTDLYALGCTVYQLLSGRPPFTAQTVATMAYQHVCLEPEPLADLAPEDTPVALIAWVERAMEKAPERRHPSAQQALDELLPLLGEAGRKAPSAESHDLPDRPYRHLEPFTRAHAPVFFGRKRKVRQLHAAVTDEGGAPIVLLYGPSGVGKSSLLDAGLRPRLEGTHDVLYARRDPSKGLLPQLRGLLEAGVDGSIRKAWRGHEADAERPLVVVLDQVEEVYTQPGPDGDLELPQLVEALQRVFALRSTRPRGRLVLSFRKEWLAEFEELLGNAGLPFTRSGVAALTRHEVLEVIRGPTSTARLRQAYRVEFEEGLFERIADTLLRDHQSALAPTLQILLTKLWTTTAPTWSDKHDADVRQFTHAAVDALVAEGLFLSDFVDAQVAQLEAWKPEVVQSGLLLDVLVQHTTAAGTARSVGGEALSDAYPHMMDTLPELLRRCKDAYLLAGNLRGSGDTLEGASRLAHDTLAPLVRQRFEDSDLPGQRAARILHARAPDWRDGQTAEPLDARDLALVEAGVTGTRAWTADDKRLVQASQERRAKAQRGRRILQAVAGLVVVVIAGLGAFAWYQQGEAGKAANDADEARKLAETREKETKAVLEVSQTHNLLARFDDAKKGAPRIATALAAVQAYRRHQARPIGDTSQLYEALAEAADPVFAPRIIDAHGARVAEVRFIDDNQVLSAGQNTVKLWDLTQPEAPVASHELPSLVTSVGASRKGKVVAAVTLERGVYVFEDGPRLARRREVGRVAKSPWGVDVSPDGTLVAATVGTQVLVWRLDNPGAKPRVFAGERQTRPVKFSPDGRTLGFGDGNGFALVDLQAAADIPVQVQRTHNEPIMHLFFQGDGRRLLTSGPDGLLQIRGVPGLALDQAVQGHDRLRTAAISGDGRWLVAGFEDMTAQLHDLTSPHDEPRKLGRSNAPATRMAMSPDGRWVVEGAEDGRLRVWDVGRDAGTRIDDLVHLSDFAVMKDGTRATIGLWGQVLLISPDGARRELYLDPLPLKGPPVPESHPTRRLAGRLLELINSGRVVDEAAASRIYDRRPGQPGSRWKPGQMTSALGQLSSVYAPVRLDESALLAPDTGSFVANTRHKVRVHFTLTTVDVPDVGPRAAKWAFTAAGVGAIALGVDHSSTRIATGGYDDGVVRIFRRGTTTPERRLKGHAVGKPITALAFSHDDQRLATGTFEGELLVWDLRAPNTKPLAMMKLGGSVARIDWHPSQPRFATASEDGTLSLWEPGAGSDPIKTVRAHKQASSVAYTPDGTRLVSGGADALVQVRDAEDPSRVLHTYEGHTGLIKAMAINRQGTHVASVALDGTLRVWDLRDYKALPEAISGHPAELVGVGMDPNGRPVTATQTHNSEVHSWPSKATLAARICDQLWRNMTREEWTSLVGADIPYEATCPNLPVPRETP